MRQYIGARYMPKFMGTYDATTAYEALSVVDNGMGTSYVANKPVPAGTPLTNSAYWSIYGSTNGAIIQLQQDLADLKAELESGMQGRRIVILTDSYGEITDNFVDQMLAQEPDLVLNDNIFKFAYGGAGFSVAIGLGYSFTECFVSSGDIDTITEPSTITDFIICSGSNDKGQTYANIASGAATLIPAIKAKFTNATVYIAATAYTKAAAGGALIPQLVEDYALLSTVQGCRFIGNSYTWVHYTGFVSDNVHPTAAGSRRIAEGLLREIFGVSSSDVSVNHDVGLTYTGIMGTISNTPKLMSRSNGQSNSVFLTNTITLADGTTIYGNGSWKEICSIDSDSFLYGAIDGECITMSSIRLNYNNTWHTFPCHIKLYNNKLYMRIELDSAIPNFNNGVACNSIEIGPFCIEKPAIFF